MVIGNQTQKIHRFFAATNCYHKRVAGWELPTDDILKEVGRGIDRAHGVSVVQTRMRRPLTTWPLLLNRRAAVFSMKGRSILVGTGIVIFPCYVPCVETVGILG